MNRTPLILSVALHALGVSAAIGLAVAGSWPVPHRPARIALRPSEARIAVEPTPDRPQVQEPVAAEPSPPLEAEVHEPDVVEPEPAEFEPVSDSAAPRPTADTAPLLPPSTPAEVVLWNPAPTDAPADEPEEQTPPQPVVESRAAVHVEATALDDQNDPPDYPRIALRRGWQGEVLVRLDIGTDGRVEAAKLIRSSGHACLDTAALTAVRSWRYQPAQNRDGQPVASQLDVPVEFLLDLPRHR